ncbi:hypothetical protein VDGD_03894 [Verticillium dahliae]|nr:60S acidic ribosomal protein P0 [Verticillium dahliae VDG1]RBQ86998.1 hypothetical protein VDGD_03894 [Verticillium dahliae]
MHATNLRYDAEYKQMLDSMPAGPQPPLDTIGEVRAFFENLYRSSFAAMPVAEDVEITSNEIPTYDGAGIKVYKVSSDKTASASGPQPAVLYFHGGGMICGCTNILKPLIAHYVSHSGVTFYSVDYRLAPEHPAPTAIEDAYAALKFLVDHAAEDNIDATRICLMGDSAGGLVATGCAILARDRDLEPRVAMQLLVYPMLDDRTTLPEDDPLWPFLSYKPFFNTRSWKAYLEDGVVSGHSVPARQQDLGGMPRTYVEVGSLDLFLGENLTYASRLAEAGVEVELRVWPGLPHGFDLVFGLNVTKKALQSRLNALKRL